MYGVQHCVDAHDIYIAVAYYMDYIEMYQIVCLISTLSLRIYFPPRCYIIRIIYSFTVFRCWENWFHFYPQ